MYKEKVATGSKWAGILKRAFTIPRELNHDLQAPEDLEPYFLFRDATFCYNNEALSIRVEKDEFEKDMFLLVYLNKIVGYFEPAA